ncbi:MAG: hypothetical protein GY701_21025 [Sulfitobacter sp.]|nr:hypothetical protein [Sulfitobacter sp.]
MSGENVSDRLTGRADSGSEKDLLRGAKRAETRDDSSEKHAADGRLAPRINRILSSMSDLDFDIIDVLTVVRMASGNQLNRLFWPTTPAGARASRRRLKRLTDLRVLTRLHRQVGGIRGGSQGYTYALDVNGQRIAQSLHHNTIRRPTPSDSFVNHTLAVTEAYIVLKTTPTIELLEFQPEPACWRSYTGSAGRSLTLRPDGFAAWAAGEWELSAFLEIDRATEHPGRIARKADQYFRYWRTGEEQRRNEVFPTVLWVAPTEQRARVLCTVLEGHAAAALCVVISDGELADFITNTTREEGHHE